MKEVVIIGNGIAGITAARHIRKLSSFNITVIGQESQYFFSRPALMYVYMGHLRWQDIEPYEQNFWKKNKISLIQDVALNFDFEERTVKLKENPDVHYDYLILATGSVPNEYSCPGIDLTGVSHFYSKQDLEKIEAISNKVETAVIVGGGLIGIELAEMFRSRNKKVVYLVREKSYWSNILPTEESHIINEHIKDHHIELNLKTELESIHGDNQVEYIKTRDGKKIDCQFVGITVGVKPNIEIFRNTGLTTHKGLLVNEFLETNIPNVFAIGDCSECIRPQSGRKPIEAVWYVGKKMGETVAVSICKERTKYNPGVWYNSAKFLDIEYQTYGNVLSTIDDDHDCLYWEEDKKCIRIVYDKKTLAVTGFNLLGVRFRHEVCEKWIIENTPIENVVKQIRLAFFDPEFYKDLGNNIKMAYEKKMNRKIEINRVSNFNSIYTFLNK